MPGYNQTSAAFGASSGVAVLGSIWTAFYRSKIGLAMAEHISHTDAETVRGTLGGAIYVARKLNNHSGESLIQNAREAFMRSLNITAAVCAAMVIIVAPIVWLTFRKSIL